LFFVVSGVSIVFIFGLGYLIANFLCFRNDHSPFIEKIPFILTTGFLINHFIFLVVQSLKLSLLIGLIISFCALVWLFTQKWPEFKSVYKKNRFPLIFIFFILLLYYFTILLEPLKWWDARSIWFFHAKMIWSAESINLNAGWLNQFIPHADYPKLIPALAAQLSYVLGYWNEYSPKLSLFLILIPPVFWIFSFYSRSFSFLFLVLVFPFGLYFWLWNGSMDGYVAFYSAVSMLLLGRYFKHRRQLDLMSSISCLALISNLKNEGMLIGLIGMFSIALMELSSGKFKLSELKKYFSIYRLSWLTVIISPSIIWSVVYKNKWGLANDLKIGTMESFSSIISRFSDGVSFPLIIEKTIFHDGSSVLLSLVTFIVSIFLLKASKRYVDNWIPALITAFVYYFGLVAIYLLTPADLNRHLDASVQRTMLTVSSCIIAGTFIIFNELEDKLI
jgi:hypothetical protein